MIVQTTKRADSSEIAANPSDTARPRCVNDETAAPGPTDQLALDVPEVAAIFKCSREKIKRMARRGEIPAFKFGKQWYLRREDLERFLAARVECTGHLRRIQEV